MPTTPSGRKEETSHDGLKTSNLNPNAAVFVYKLSSTPDAAAPVRSSLGRCALRHAAAHLHAARCCRSLLRVATDVLFIS